MALTDGWVNHYWSQESYVSSPSEPSGLGELDFSDEQWKKRYVNDLSTPTLESYEVQSFFKQYMKSEAEHPVTEPRLPNCQPEATREEPRRDCDDPSKLIGLVEDEVRIMEKSSTNSSSSEGEDSDAELVNLGNYGRQKSSIEEPPELELKPLPEHLEYAFLEKGSKLPVIIASDLTAEQKERLLSVLGKHKRAIAWKISDIKGINPSFCTHKILMEDNHRPKAIPQRRLNPNMKEVVKNEVIKLLDAGIIYPISDSAWVSPVQVVPKKGGMTVITNEKNELVPTRTVTGWRVCIDYRKLNDATRKDHFPLPFIDQMLERLAGHSHYCFLDGLSGYFQIPIAPVDQEKTTFTCPYGTFVYRRMPFGLCNAPATFQRCMLAIFEDMVEDIMEVFMDDFSVFGNSFELCLSNLERFCAGVRRQI